MQTYADALLVAIPVFMVLIFVEALYGAWIAVLRGAVGVAFIVASGEWFGLGEWLPLGDLWVAIYFVATALGGIVFGWYQLPRPAAPELATE